jgi:hypothetical protein
VTIGIQRWIPWVLGIAALIILCASLWIIVAKTPGEGGSTKQANTPALARGQTESREDTAREGVERNENEPNEGLEPFEARAFVREIDNPYFPLKPGTVFIYEGQSDARPEKDEVSVTSDTKTILGIVTTVVRDKTWVAGRLVEDTRDWYAQDRKGTVWCFGEDSAELDKNGKLRSTEGSWVAGKHGARPGIIMEAKPAKGDTYYVESANGVAEDQAGVLSLAEHVTVPYGSYDGCLRTKEWSRLESGVVENKYYAPGVGLILAKTVKGGAERLELVNVISANTGNR